AVNQRLEEIMRHAQIGVTVTKQPFTFFMVAAMNPLNVSEVPDRRKGRWQLILILMIVFFVVARGQHAFNGRHLRRAYANQTNLAKVRKSRWE
ncbi:hypothetical protein, partial [Klebsiella pneumoniae]|uniref:hypothetical protein n=1 Tax=Klebsiella pneumoniae TaxID=573 RepID=UPI002731CD8D